MIDAHLAIALMLLFLLAGVGFSSWHFGEDLKSQAHEISDLEADLFDMTEDRDQWKAQALADQQSLELVLAEGESNPLTAPVQVVRGGIR